MYRLNRRGDNYPIETVRLELGAVALTQSRGTDFRDAVGDFYLVDRVTRIGDEFLAVVFGVDYHKVVVRLVYCGVNKLVGKRRLNALACLGFVVECRSVSLQRAAWNKNNHMAGIARSASYAYIGGGFAACIQHLRRSRALKGNIAAVEAGKSFFSQSFHRRGNSESFDGVHARESVCFNGFETVRQGQLRHINGSREGAALDCGDARGECELSAVIRRKRACADFRDGGVVVKDYFALELIEHACAESFYISGDVERLALVAVKRLVAQMSQATVRRKHDCRAHIVERLRSDACDRLGYDKLGQIDAVCESRAADCQKPLVEDKRRQVGAAVEKRACKNTGVVGQSHGSESVSRALDFIRKSAENNYAVGLRVIPLGVAEGVEADRSYFRRVKLDCFEVESIHKGSRAYGSHARGQLDGRSEIVLEHIRHNSCEGGVLVELDFRLAHSERFAVKGHRACGQVDFLGGKSVKSILFYIGVLGARLKIDDGVFIACVNKRVFHNIRHVFADSQSFETGAVSKRAVADCSDFVVENDSFEVFALAEETAGNDGDGFGHSHGTDNTCGHYVSQLIVAAVQNSVIGDEILV